MSTSPPAAVSTEFLLPGSRAGVLRAAQALTEGKLVLLPTETVYGIALNLHSAEARRSARAVKDRASGAVPAAGRDGEKVAHSPWVLHLAQPEDVLGWAPNMSAMGKRIVAKALPGPVAFQIKLDEASAAAARVRLGEAADETLQDGYLTIRCPDFRLTQEVLHETRGPVAIIGAGTAAQPGVFEPQDLPATVLNDPDAPQFALDGGPTRYRRSSTMVKIDGEKYEVTRVGVIDERIIHKMADFTILFICSGNTCRSPMASAIAAKQIADRLGIAPSELPLRHIVVQSAGLHAGRGMRAALEAMDAVKEFGADLTSHISQPATPDLLRRADVIYTMTASHRDEILEIVPNAERKTFLLDPEGDIADPIGSSLSVYQQVAYRISETLHLRLDGLPV